MFACALHNMINNNDNLSEKAAWACDVVVVQVKFCLTGKPAKPEWRCESLVPAWTRERCPVAAG